MITYYVDNTTTAGTPRLTRVINHCPGSDLTPGCDLFPAFAPQALAGVVEDLDLTYDLVDSAVNSVTKQVDVAGDDCRHHLHVEHDQDGERPRRRPVGVHFQADPGLHPEPHIDGRLGAQPGERRSLRPESVGGYKALVMQKSNERGIALITTMLVLMLISALLIGFTTVVMSDQRYRFIDGDRVKAFYGASGGMEKLTADLGNLFLTNVAPTNAQVTALTRRPASRASPA